MCTLVNPFHDSLNSGSETTADVPSQSHARSLSLVTATALFVRYHEASAVLRDGHTRQSPKY